MEGGREVGRELWREGGRERGREGARERGSEGARERGREGGLFSSINVLHSLYAIQTIIANHSCEVVKGKRKCATYDSCPLRTSIPSWTNVEPVSSLSKLIF